MKKVKTTDCLQQAEDYVRGCTWQLKKVKTADCLQQAEDYVNLRRGCTGQLKKVKTTVKPV